MAATTANPFDRENWSPTLAEVDYRNAGRAMAAENARLKRAKSVSADPAVGEDMQQQIAAAVAAGRVTKCPSSAAWGVGQYDDLPRGCT